MGPSQDQDPSADFGRVEGTVAYLEIAKEHPDWPMEILARYAVQLQMIIRVRLDINDETAACAIIGAFNTKVDILS